MKKQVWSFVILLIFISPNIYGQSQSPRGAISDKNIGWQQRSGMMRGNTLPREQAADFSIGYYDSLLPSLGIDVPTIVGTSIVPEYGERITMAAETGYLDSIQITLDSISGDSIEIDFFSDTLFSTAAGAFHLMNIFDQNNPPVTLGFIDANEVHGRTMVSLPVPHMAVQSQNFWIGVEPNFNNNTGGFTNTFVLVGDSESIVPRTADNCRSGFIAESGGEILSAVYDSTFLSTSGTPIYSNFYITAFVSNSPSSVSGNQPSSSISVFPNPASTFLHFQGASGTSHVELLDLLGRQVLLQNMEGNGNVDVSNIPHGSYEAVVRSASGMVAIPVIIQH